MTGAPPARIERLDEGSNARACVLEHRVFIETFAREALVEPGFDVERELTRPFSRCFAAWIDDEGAPCGIFVGQHVADELHILDVAVSAAHRRRKIATSLVEAALADARAAGMNLALLEVRHSNVPAIKLYRSLGFLAERVRKNYYAEPVEDAVEMTTRL